MNRRGGRLAGKRALMTGAGGLLGGNRDCTGLAIHLASDESAFTSGQRVFIDGGRF